MTNLTIKLEYGDIIVLSSAGTLCWFSIPYKVEYPVHGNYMGLVRVTAPDGFQTVVWSDDVKKCGIWGKTVYTVLKMLYSFK